MGNVVDMKGRPIPDKLHAGLEAVRRISESYNEEVELALSALISAAAHLDVAAQLCTTEGQVKEALVNAMGIRVLAGHIRIKLR